MKAYQNNNRDYSKPLKTRLNISASDYRIEPSDNGEKGYWIPIEKEVLNKPIGQQIIELLHKRELESHEPYTNLLSEYNDLTLQNELLESEVDRLMDELNKSVKEINEYKNTILNILKIR